MNAQMLLQSFSGGADEKTYVDDVFSTYLYTGNGSTQTINNGIDLAGEGGLVWTKHLAGTQKHILVDSAQGINQYLSSNLISSATTGTDLQSFNYDGFTFKGYPLYEQNESGKPYASWTFRRAPKFFDIVTYTGNGVSNRQIVHELGIAPGFITTKATSTTGDWNSYHRSATGDLVLNSTAAQTGSRAIVTAANSSTFTVSGVANTSGVIYVAYLFAHDPAEDGVIQCGSYIGNSNSSGNLSVTLGFEPQFLLIKAASAGTGGGSWAMMDDMRGLKSPDAAGRQNPLYSNASSAEDASINIAAVTATGFILNNNSAAYNALGESYIYLAIRRPNKPPTSGTEVYNAIARTGTGAVATVTGAGFAPDLVMIDARSNNIGYGANWWDRLRGANSYLDSSRTAPENSSYTDELTAFGMSGVTLGASGNGVANNLPTPYINHFFRRAPGFFDVVCYTGTGVARTVPHGLGVAPELMIVKCRSAGTNWAVYHQQLTATNSLWLNTTNASQAFGSIYWNTTAPTTSVVSLGTDAGVNDTSRTYVAYLFASLPGISKVGSYTGNGTSLTVECGFSTGARFILAKSIDDAGDSFIWDSARGIVAANDPHLSLNTTAAEVTTDDSVDPYAGGFIVNQNTATKINITGKRYIFLAIA